MSKDRQEAIYSFWFGKQIPGGPAFPAWYAYRFPRWFGGSKRTDRLIREKFLPDHLAAASGALDSWGQTPRGRLTLILVLDQFSRHIHRGRAEAFLQDPRAQRLCLEGLEHNVEKSLHPIEQVFFSLPLVHAEDRHLQDRSVALMERLCRDASGPLRLFLRLHLASAREHRDTVYRFGRFPYRNPARGQTDTPEEEVYRKGRARKFLKYLAPRPVGEHSP